MLTYTQFIVTGMHGLPMSVKRPDKRGKSRAGPQTQTEWVHLADWQADNYIHILISRCS